MTKIRLRLALTALLLVIAVATVRLDHDDERAVWTLHAPGVEVVGLSDAQAGPVIWLYWRGAFVGHWRWREPPEAPRVTPGRPAELKEA